MKVINFIFNLFMSYKIYIFKRSLSLLYAEVITERQDWKQKESIGIYFENLGEN